MVRLRTDRLRAATCVSIAAWALACGSGGGASDPGAGQTGSPVVGPVVPPDHSSPGQFRPPVPAPPGGGASPTLPGRPLTPPRLTASYGAWLYVVTPGGSFAFDTGAPATGAPTAQLLPQAAPRWIGIEGNALSVIASVLPEEPADVERGQLTRLYRFDLSRDPGAPELLGSVELPGDLVLARLEAGRLVALSAEQAAPSCAPQLGTVEGWAPPERFVVSDLRAQSGGWSLAGSASVEAQGFIETEGAIVLVRGGYSGLPSALTAVAIGADALTTSATLNVGGETLPRAAMAVEGQRLALFQDTTSGLQLQVHPLTGGAPSMLPVVASTTRSQWDSLDAAQFDGRFALVPAASAEPAQTGAIIDWLREGGPAVTAQLPADLPNLARLGDRWLGWGTARSVLFRVGAAGTFDVERELGLPFDGRFGLGVHWDAPTQLALLPYLVSGSGIGSAPAAYALSVLDLSSPSPAWRAGPHTAGSPDIATFGRAGYLDQGLQLQRTQAGWFGLTDAGELLEGHRLVEAFDLASATSAVVGFGERTLAASLSQQGSARLLADYRGTRAVSVSNADGSDTATTHLALGFGADRLQRTSAGWLSYSLTYSNACYGSELFSDTPCLPSGNAALSLLASAPPRLVHDTELPRADTIGTPPAFSREWLEVIAQGNDVGLLAHRALRCTSEAECDALGVEYEVDELSGRGQCDASDTECLANAPDVVRRVLGYQNQRWLHPYDSGTGQFRAPVRLPDTDGQGWLSASGVHVEGQPALVWLDPLEIASDGYSVTRARIQLVRFPSLLGASPDNQERITVPGFPLSVSANRAVSIEPAGLLDASGASVGALVHRLELRDGNAYLAQTLELPPGDAGHLWAEQRGYVLSIGDDRCAAPSATLISLRLVADVLEEAGRLELPGTGWQLAQASDELVLLTRTIGDLNQHALIDVDGTELRLRGYETRPGSVKVSLFGDRAWFAP